jgi:hypothetical protein
MIEEHRQSNLVMQKIVDNLCPEEDPTEHFIARKQKLDELCDVLSDEVHAANLHQSPVTTQNQGENSMENFYAPNLPSPNCMGNILQFISFSPMMQHYNNCNFLACSTACSGTNDSTWNQSEIINNLLMELFRPGTTELSCHQVSNRILKRQKIK